MFGVQRKKKSIRQKIITTESEEEEEVQIIEPAQNLLNKASLLSFNDDEDEGEIFKIKKTKKQKLKKVLKRFDEEDKEEIVKEEQPDLLPPPFEEQKITSVIRSGNIPNASMIFAAKKHRQLAREIQIDNDDLETNYEKVFENVLIDDKKTTINSRLVRDDEHDFSDEGEEHVYGKEEVNPNERHTYTSSILENESKEAFKSKQELLKYLEVRHGKESSANGFDSGNELIEDESEIDSEEEEFRKWENEQIKKGYNMPQLLNLPSKHQNSISNIMQNLPMPTAILNHGGLYPVTPSLISETANLLHDMVANKRNLKFKQTTTTATTTHFISSQSVHPPETTTTTTADAAGNNIGLFDTRPADIDFVNNLTNQFNKKITIPAFIYDDQTKLRNTQSFNSDIIKHDIEKRIESLKSTVSGFRGDLNFTVGCQTTNEVLLENVQNENVCLEGDFEFYGQFKEYLDCLIDCHNEKMATVIALENRIQNLWKQRANRLINRRQQDLKDESQEYSISQTEPPTQESGLKRRITEREARRTRRLKSRGTKMKHEGIDVDSGNDIPFGFSSDDEENYTETDSFTSQLDTITNDASKIFEDVLEDYSDPEFVFIKFREWKRKNLRSYTEAYVNMYLCMVLQNFVRLENLRWNPLDFDNLKQNYFHEYPWFLNLLTLIDKFQKDIDDVDDLTTSTTQTNEPPSRAEETLPGITMKKDEEGHVSFVIPNVIQNVFLPKLSFIIQNVYDPLSLTQTIRITKFFEYLSRNLPFFTADNTKIQDLFKIIQTRFQKSLENDIYIPILPINSLHESIKFKYTSYQSRQLWTAIKLMGNIISWRRLLSYEMMKELAFDGILNRYLIIGLQNSVLNKGLIAKCFKIFQISKPFYKSDSTKVRGAAADKSSHDEFEPFKRYLKTVKQTLKEVVEPSTSNNKNVIQIMERNELMQAQDKIAEMLDYFTK